MAKKQAIYEEALNNGHSFSWDHRWQEAIAEFEKAVEVFGDQPAPYAGLGMAYNEMGRLRKALENYKLAARYSQGDIIYLSRIAEIQERMGQSKEAAQTFMAIGEVQLRRRLLDEAVENWHHAVRLDPDQLSGHQRLAAVYQRQGLVQSAVRELLAVARIMQASGNRIEAAKAARSALQLDARNPDVLTTVELIKKGELIPEFEETENLTGEDIDARNFSGDGDWLLEEEELSNPVQDAQRMAMEQLAGEIFDESDEDDDESFGDVDLATKWRRDALISQALDYQTRGMTNEAINSYREAIAAGVTSTAVHFNLGLLYQDKLRFREAIAQFETVMNDPEYRIAAHFALGESYRGLGNMDKAVKHFVTVLKIVDLSVVERDQADRLIELYENLANSLMVKGEAEKATGFANALVEFLSHKGWQDKVREARQRLNALPAGNTMILGDILTAGSDKVLESLYLSQEYARRELYEAAMEEAYRAIQLAPNYLPAHMQLGSLQSKQGNQPAAIQKFSTVGNTFRTRGDAASAIQAYEQVVSIAPLDLSIRARLIDLLKRHGQIDRSLEHYLALGDAYYQMAQLDKARDTYQEALKLAPRGAVEHKWRSRFLRLISDIDMQRLDWHRALAAYRELHQEDPEDERTVMTLIDLYHKVGQSAYALRELDQYLIHLIRGGRGLKVLGILEDMVQRFPSDSGLVDRLVKLYSQQGRKDEAIALLDRLGEDQLNAGQREEAVATVSKIIALKPTNVAQYEQLLANLEDELG